MASGHPSDSGNGQEEARIAGEASVPLSRGILMSREIKERWFAQAWIVHMLYRSQTSMDSDTIWGHLSQLQVSLDATSTLSLAGPGS